MRPERLLVEGQTSAVYGFVDFLLADLQSRATWHKTDVKVIDETPA